MEKCHVEFVILIEQIYCSVYKMGALKRQPDLQASYTNLIENFTRNSMMAIIFVKNVWLRNGSHFKIKPPKSRGAICDQTVSLIKKMEENRPPLFFNPILPQY